jgi:hypothetical protein
LEEDELKYFVIQLLHKFIIMVKRMAQAQKDPIVHLVELENDILYQEYANGNQPEYAYIKGNIPILISAPHGAVHTREGNIKEEDEYTAGLARLISNKTGAHVIYLRRKSRTDPNADETAPYKQTLRQIVQENKINFVLDLHGANKERNFGIALGTMHGKSCSEKEKQIIVRTFEKYGISETGLGLSRLDEDNQLPGEGNDRREPIVKFCHRNTIPAAQIEINACLRIPKRREDASAPYKNFKGDKTLIKSAIEALSAIVFSIVEG